MSNETLTKEHEVDKVATPEPWEVGGYTTGFVNQIAIKPSIGCAYGKGSEAEANARLMAAAPDLLKALEKARSYGSAGWDDWLIDLADAALAKATGAK